MKLLILGGNGMAGHVLKEFFASKTQYDVFWTQRHSLPDDPHCFFLDVTNTDELKKLLEKVNPDVVINATGILNDAARQHLLDAIHVNSILPHLLSDMSGNYHYYLIHISTDCVFSGSKGKYTETDPKDGGSVYAQTKSLGEVTDDKNLTIRTSIIGPELKDGIGLFHWFMNQKQTIKGFRNVFWNGLTTLELAKAIEELLEHRLTGLIHLTGNRFISKYELLLSINQTFERGVAIIPDDDARSDKSLVMTREDVPYQPVSYEQMLEELKRWIDDRPHLYQYA
ncbi:dTDP-4-dehydrorhamnose reductase [Bacillus glycinifermentans]|uniref:dTDP-4-dehydrorhamnose reductase n=1 Tax=Bacillus glycinifermentans TaxID=1664069 RepID=A0A0J6E192_9BACI|nr:SDR family oxidoreductase [Bacillus glycinifermentans]ATH93707.1 NAD(P)-dependent oxidoreductase [Bacillus glycinifermentans]KMM56716.1 dTDP-4-dehydrorhamnose reductase [Bacillus glycinifermentans]KRT90118.1 NAD(P)-dependent oxidoreductase [Bacillus glycinifermentans]MEC0483801.1 SDR family oxidoreductase [Bacillus glycinifermentans]MEC0496295.1 SDR family oxidoreductase [Bacillus glycinifermentans]